MTTKESLRSLRAAELEIGTLKSQLERLRKQRAVLAETASQSTLSRKKAAATRLATERLETLYADALLRLETRHQKTLARILALSDGTQKSLLLLYYCDGHTWPEVADALGYSERQTMRLHDSALKAVEGEACCIS